MSLLFIFLTLEELELERPIEESSYLTQLEYLAQHPIDPNQAKIEDWLLIPFISPVEAYRLVEGKGSYQSLEDLRQAGLDRDRIAMLRPFVRIGKEIKRSHSDIRLRYQLFNPESLSDSRLYTRTQFQGEKIRLFLTTEKDPYERSYLDYLGGGILIRQGRLTGAIGRYHLELGEGLLLGPEPFDFLRDYDFQSPRRGIIPYPGVGENYGLFGVALSYRGFIGFYSNYRLDGSVRNDTIRGIDYQGLHTDSASLANRDRLREVVYGLGYQLGLGDDIIGIKGYRLRYRPGIYPEDSLPFYGEDLNLWAIDLRRYGHLGELFFEGGFSGRSFGLIGGFIARIGELGLSGTWSHYPPDFYSPHGGIVEPGRDLLTANIGLIRSEYRIGLRSCYRYRIDDESEYYDLRPYLNYHLPPFRSELELRYRFGSIPSYERGASFRFTYRLSKLRLRLRIVDRTYPDEPTGLYGGVEITIFHRYYRLTLGYGRYSAPGPIYIYQPDLPGRFNTLVLSGSGQEYYLIIGLKPLIGMKFYLKLSNRVFGLQTDLTF
ncbi:hypothetical protein DRP53_00395 [candidate division WOR-3 bacterium]|uniref:Helix-hairpin-helix domain-containing protein n=1 Tax=candidate division WOR-3 bacterium TaxID=2052148 RepID=A0A660SLY6_UNCW3|nr:MAG: hypothetical protein DRP53_00395 [candidate division WOR-3 bacterium]